MCLMWLVAIIALPLLRNYEVVRKFGFEARFSRDQDKASRRAISSRSFHYPVKRIRETQWRVNEERGRRKVGGGSGGASSEILLISQRRFAQPRKRFGRRELIPWILARWIYVRTIRTCLPTSTSFTFYYPHLLNT